MRITLIEIKGKPCSLNDFTRWKLLRLHRMYLVATYDGRKKCSFFSKEPFRWSLETRRIDLRISLVAMSKRYFLWKRQFFSGGKNRSSNMENGIEDKRQECNQYNNLVTAEYCHEVTGCSSFSVSRKLQTASYELTVSSFISKESSVAHKFSLVNTYLWNYLFVDKLTMMLMQVEIITIYMHILFEFR